MKSIITSFALFLMIFPVSFGQHYTTGEIDQNFYNSIDAPVIGNSHYKTDLYEGVVGSPYVMENWGKGVVYMEDSTKVEDIDIKLDAYKNEVVYYDPARKQEFILDRNKIVTFELFDSFSMKHQYVKITDDEGAAFYEVLSSGKVLLLKRHWKYLKEADYQGAYNSGVRHDEFIDRTTYYVYDGDEGLEKIKLSKGKVLRYFKNEADNYDAVQNYYEVNNLDLGKEADVTTLFSYYNNSL